MAEKLAAYMVAALGGKLSRELIVFAVSLMPVLELRGGIIAGFALNMEFLPTFLIAFLGNILPVPFILMFINWLFGVLKKTRFKKIPELLEARALKQSDSVKKYQYLGLLLFVGVPLPGTGAWTGALLASLLEMDKKKAFFAILFGVLLAGIIVSILSFGLLGMIFK